jgi:hypothetical protein
MGVVVVAAIGFAAIRNANDVWAGLMMLVTGAVLVLAVVGAASRRGKDRAWWLGFSLFGWAYLLWAASDYNELTDLPPVSVPQFLDAKLRAGSDTLLWDRFGDPSRSAVWDVGRWLWCLVLACAGGTIARLLFGGPTKALESPEPSALDSRAPRRSRRLIAAMCTLAAFYAGALIVVQSRVAPPGFVAGLVFLLTMGLLGTAVLAAVYASGRRRYAWLGAALFGGGYLILAFIQTDDWNPSPGFPTSRLLNAIRQSDLRVLTGGYLSPAIAERNNQRIVEALGKPLEMSFPNETPIEDVLQYVQDATRTPDGWELPIYVDPVGLQEAEKTMTSPVTISLKRVPLQTTLRLMLEQLGLDYRVRDGILLISSDDDETPVFVDPFLTVGHCLLSLIAAGLGGLLAPLMMTHPAKKSNVRP